MNLSLSSERYFGAIDLGSNSCRFLIVEKIGLHLKTIEVFSRVVRLSEGLSTSSYLSDEAIERTFSVLAQCVRKIRLYSPLILECVATEACRRAQNSSFFLERVKSELGLDLKVISEQEEARLAVRGCGKLFDTSIPYAILFDIGGGSTEVIWVKLSPKGDLQILDMLSLPFGVVTVSESYNVEKAGGYQEVVNNVWEAIEHFSPSQDVHDAIAQGKVQMIGSSGTATIVGGIHLGLHFYNRRRVDGICLTFDEIYSTIKQIQLMTNEERDHHPCIGIDRSDLTLGGIAILEGICRALPVGKMTIGDRGVRDGIVLELAFGPVLQQEEKILL